MPVKLRLARHGRKKFAFYHIVAADGRAPRDGKFIEKLGIYNPNTNPATIELDFDKSLDWLLKGAQPTETVRAILSYKGVLMKRHLLDGVRKGAFSEEEAEKRYAAWLKEKEGKIQAKVDGLTKSRDDNIKGRLEAETKVNEKRAAEILKKNSELAEKDAQEAEAASADGEEAAVEVDKTSAEAIEVVKEEVKDEVKEEVKAEEEKVEVKDEAKVAKAPAAEEVAEKKPEAAKVEETGAEGKEAEESSKGEKAEEQKAEGGKPAKQASEKKEDPKESKDKTE